MFLAKCVDILDNWKAGILHYIAQRLVYARRHGLGIEYDIGPCARNEPR